MEELLFYTVDRNYIKYLSLYEKHVSYNKDEIGQGFRFSARGAKLETLYKASCMAMWGVALC